METDAVAVARGIVVLDGIAVRGIEPDAPVVALSGVARDTVAV